jgi:hypothetical protein
MAAERGARGDHCYREGCIRVSVAVVEYCLKGDGILLSHGIVLVVRARFTVFSWV